MMSDSVLTGYGSTWDKQLGLDADKKGYPVNGIKEGWKGNQHILYNMIQASSLKD